MGDNWNCQAIIERLCILQSEVATHQGFMEHSADCFCKQGGFWVEDMRYSDEPYGGWRNDGKALEFIEQAAREKIEREQTEADQ